jgi:nucleoside-diphosphate-sugar epimerase
VKFTIFGSTGFLGTHLRQYLLESGHRCIALSRSSSYPFHENLGHVIYCIGLTGDFRIRPFETVDAHVCELSRILQNAQFDSFLYLSSTRVYAGADSATEDTVLRVDPANRDHLYNLSKMMGESLCLATPKPNIRIARLSNVYGPDFSSCDFLSSIVRDAISTRKIILRTTPSSAKDYINVSDVVRILPSISESGQYHLYNVASGRNTTNGELIEIVQSATGCSVEVEDGADQIIFPPLSIKRLKEEFGFLPSHDINSLQGMIHKFVKESRS